MIEGKRARGMTEEEILADAYKYKGGKDLYQAADEH